MYVARIRGGSQGRPKVGNLPAVNVSIERWAEKRQFVFQVLGAFIAGNAL
jgi:hypothetical protein